jgi:hypothetical protein
MKKIYTIILFIALTASNLIGQCMLYPVSLTDRVNNSSIIIEGSVISKKSFWNTAHNFIYTSNLVQVKQVLKGTLNSSFIEVITTGGEIEDRRITAEPSLKLNDMQEGVFMVNFKNTASQFGYNTFEVYADEQGFIKFDTRENSARDPFNTYDDINTDLYKAIGDIMNVTLPFYSGAQNPQAKFNDASQIAAVTGISPTTISAGTGSILTITGTGFGTGPSATNFVSFPSADDGGATLIGAHASQYVSWTPTQIQVRVPTRTNGSGTAGTGPVRVTTTTGFTNSAVSLTVNYGHLNVISPSPTTAASTVYNTRHINDNTLGGYTWQYFTGFAGNAPAVASFERSMKTWTCTTYINWRVGANTAVNTVASDGVCVVRFDIGTELPTGVLGVCYSYFGGCGSNPNMNWFISELDIVFNDSSPWQYGPANPSGSQMDFESVATHELGHGHQLSHVINSAGVMHYSIGNGQNKRTLNTGDITGGNAVMARSLSGGVCSQGIMTAMSAALCTSLAPTASFVATPTQVCTGQVVSMTDQSLNGPSTWTWTMTGGTPASSNVQNPTVTYATAGVKTISLICSNSNGSSAIFSRTVNVLASPTIVVSSATICPTKVATLTATGSSGGYTWTPGSLVGATQALSPASTQVYNVVGTNGTCNGTGTGTVTVLPGATPVVANAAICAGSPTLMTATGATTYTWNPGNLNGNSQTLSPGATTTYTVLGTTGTCTGSTTFVISTTTVLTGVSITPNNITLCTGQTTVLTASGATTYTWNTSANTTTLLASNATSTVYTVTGKTGSCSGTASATVNISTCSALTPNSAEVVASIYPNPTQGTLVMKFSNSFNGTVNVYNAIGQLVMEKKLSDITELELNISEQANGVYMMKVKPDNGSEKIFKVIKQ